MKPKPKTRKAWAVVDGSDEHRRIVFETRDEARRLIYVRVHGMPQNRYSIVRVTVTVDKTRGKR